MSTWKLLASPPLNADTDVDFGSAPITINKDRDFLLFPHCRRRKSVLKYNVKKNKWTEWSKYPFNITYNTTSIDSIKQTIYMFTGCGKIMEIDLETKGWKTSTDTFGRSYHSNSIFINGKYCIFGALEKNKEGYLCWDPKTQIDRYFNYGLINYTNNLRVHSIHHIPRINTLCLSYTII